MVAVEDAVQFALDNNLNPPFAWVLDMFAQCADMGEVEALVLHFAPVGYVKPKVDVVDTPLVHLGSNVHSMYIISWCGLSFSLAGGPSSAFASNPEIVTCSDCLHAYENAEKTSNA